MVRGGTGAVDRNRAAGVSERTENAEGRPAVGAEDAAGVALRCPQCAGLYAGFLPACGATPRLTVRCDSPCPAGRASARALSRLLACQPKLRWPEFAAARLLAVEPLWPSALRRTTTSGRDRLQCLRQPWRALLLAARKLASLPDEARLRLARPEDAVRIVALVESAYRGERSRRGWTTEADLLDGQRTDLPMVREILAARGNAILLLERGEVLGCAHLRREERVAWFGLFAVQPEAQGRGIGGAMLAAAELFARERWRCRELRMMVISLRRELIAWYDRRGYRPTGERAPFPYGNERFGRPRRGDLEFVVLARRLGMRREG